MELSPRHLGWPSVRSVWRREGTRNMSRTSAAVPMALLAALAISASSALAGASHQDASVNWHPQQGGQGHAGQVPGAGASLVRNDNGISFRISTTGLTPGNAYTLWLVVINNPSACAASPCSAGDILNNAATASQVGYAAGHVAGGAGRGTFAGSAKVGPLSGWLAGRSLDDPYAAQVQLVINDHGPKLPAFMPGMIHTYRGGCSDGSPFPPVFPPTAISDGEVGPNICRLFQSAVFLAP